MVSLAKLVGMCTPYGSHSTLSCSSSASGESFRLIGSYSFTQDMISLCVVAPTGGAVCVDAVWVGGVYTWDVARSQLTRPALAYSCQHDRNCYSLLLELAGCLSSIYRDVLLLSALLKQAL